MRGWPALLLAGLVSACSVVPERGGNTPAARLSSDEWEPLAHALARANPALREALTADAQARWSVAPKAGAPDHSRPRAPPTVLQDLLAVTPHPLLLPDDRFTALSQGAGGNQQPTASFTTALADYLLQPSVACRQPIFTRYFQERYPPAQADEPCREEVPFYVATRYEGLQAEWIAPERIRAIHLLFAGEGTGLASRFGHVALRLVICPDAHSTDAECDANLFAHRVIGFGAHINDLELDPWKAITGGYRAYMFASRFMDVYQEYAIGEFREIYSLPLRLERARREQMVRELAEIHWRFAGDYRFLSQNCTGLLQQALTTTWPEFADSGVLHGAYVRPDHFFRDLRRTALVESDRLGSLEVAEREGFFFSSTRPFYVEAVATVNAAMVGPDYADISSYLATDSGERRRLMVADQTYLARLSNERHLLDAQLMLEELAMIRSERAVMTEAAHYFHDRLPLRQEAIRRHLTEEQASAFDDCLVASAELVTRPIARRPGIPEVSMLPPAAQIPASCHTPARMQLLNEALDGVNAVDPEHWRRLRELVRYWAQCLENVRWLREIEARPDGMASLVN